MSNWHEPNVPRSMKTTRHYKPRKPCPIHFTPMLDDKCPACERLHPASKPSEASNQ